MVDKELIDEHTKDIEELKNRAPAAIKGGDFDMSEAMKIFACKSPPDNTINRIKALEDMLNGGEGVLERLKKVEFRASTLEKRLDATEPQVSDHERRIKALESMDLSPSGDIDTGAILKTVQALRSDFNGYKLEV